MRRLPALLAVAVALRMAFHALYLPAFEGPDETNHLARFVAVAERPWREGLRGSAVDGATVAAIRGHPCSAAPARTFGCPSFGAEPATFNLLRSAPVLAPVAPVGNPEGNQPPLAYGIGGAVLALWPGSLSREEALLATRLLAVLLVTLALLGPLRELARRRSATWAVGGLLLLLLPGAAEALARSATEAFVFLWSALTLRALERRSSTAALVLLLAAGPLLKLTAIPVVVFTVVALWRDGRLRAAVLGTAAALVVFPVQLARGWFWGGVYELNRSTAPLHETIPEAIVGLARSVYAFLKTTFWLGGWTFFRAPLWLVLVFAGLGFVWLLAAKGRVPPQRVAAHLAGAAVACAGFLVFAVANRRFFGVWGGVGGWYAWGWAPWLAVAASDLAAIPPRAARPLLSATAVFVLAANAAWFLEAARVYG